MSEVKNENFNAEEPKRENNRRPRDHKGHVHQCQMGRGQGNENQWARKDVVKERLEMTSGPTTNLVSKEGISAKKFTGRCRLFVGNLPPTITDEDFRKMFEQFGEIAEVFLNPQKGFGFVKLDTRQNAENAKAALDFSMKDGKSLSVRFATHGAALKVKNLSSWVSNELLEASFSIYGDVERAVVIVDDRGRPVGEGIVEYARKQYAQMAIKRCQEGCFLLTSSPRPVVVEPVEQRDEEDGLPEKNFQKTNKQYLKEREIGPRLAEPGTFEFEFANRWKKLYELEQQKRDHLEKEIEEGRHALDEQMEYAIYEYEANLLREKLRHMEERSSMIQREREMRREEELRREEARRQQEMMLRQQQEELLLNDMICQEDSMMMSESLGQAEIIPEISPQHKIQKKFPAGEVSERRLGVNKYWISTLELYYSYLVKEGKLKVVKQEHCTEEYNSLQRFEKGTPITDIIKQTFEYHDIYGRGLKTWIINEVINSTPYGAVYSASLKEFPNNIDFAVKIGYAVYDSLRPEVTCMETIGKTDCLLNWQREKNLQYIGVSPYYDAGNFKYKGCWFTYLVVQRFGKDLQTLLKDYGSFPLKTVCLIGLSIINVLEYIHYCGYAHGDIKPANILLGREKGTEKQIFLVDFGLADLYSYYEKVGTYYEARHIGTAMFMSRDCHKGILSRRGDMESFIFNIIYFLTGNLMWEFIENNELLEIYKEKLLTNVEHFLKIQFNRENVPSQISSLLSYVIKLKLSEMPDYDFCRNLFKEMLTSTGGSESDSLEFKATEKTRYFCASAVSDPPPKKSLLFKRSF